MSWQPFHPTGDVRFERVLGGLFMQSKWGRNGAHGWESYWRFGDDRLPPLPYPPPPAHE